MKELLKGEIVKIKSFNDFEDVFYNAYTSFPYYEEWETEEIRNQYDEHVEKGYIFGCYYEGKCVGLLTLLPAIYRNHPIYFQDKSKAIYISNLAVSCEYRYHGFGTSLSEFAINFAKEHGYNEIYFRYRETHEFGKRIAKSLGFYKCYDACEEIKRSRIGGIHVNRNDLDLRFFMKKDL